MLWQTNTMFVVLILYDMLILVWKNFLDRLTDTWTDRQAKQSLNLTLCMHTCGVNMEVRWRFWEENVPYIIYQWRAKLKSKILLCRGVTYFIVLVADHATFTSHMHKYFTCNDEKFIGTNMLTSSSGLAPSVNNWPGKLILLYRWANCLTAHRPITL